MKITICDDEKIFIEDIKPIILKIFENAKISEYTNAKIMIDEFDDKCRDTDIFILDIEMAEMNGMDAARYIRSKNEKVLIIFLTNYDDFVFDSFELEAFRYIPKRMIAEKLEKALTDAKDHIKKQNSNDYIFISGEQGIKQKINYDDIVSIEKYRKYVIFTMVDKSSVKERITLNDVMNKIENNNFVQINKGLAVNITHIKIINGLEITMDNDTVQYITRGRLSDVKQILIKHWRL
jgi:DNA-binding LytR/AlgR family response regulator